MSTARACGPRTRSLQCAKAVPLALTSSAASVASSHTHTHTHPHTHALPAVDSLAAHAVPSSLSLFSFSLSLALIMFAHIAAVAAVAIALAAGKRFHPPYPFVDGRVKVAPLLAFPLLRAEAERERSALWMSWERHCVSGRVGHRRALALP